MILSMETQNQIKRTLSRSDAIEYVKNILAASDSINRAQLADHLCDQFQFFDFLKQRQQSSCLKALRELERAGHYVLPKPLNSHEHGGPRRASEPIDEPIGVPKFAGDIADLHLIQVESESQMRIWNELMIQDHPQGAGPLVGRQLYYLVKSEHGWLGGMGFSSAAIHLEARDLWIGWDWETRSANLQQIVGMSRFLIRSSVGCKNLASKILGMTTRRFPEDFAKRYGYKPLLLESFVDTSHYVGSCYKAANWQRVGRTKGLGRQGLLTGGEESIKDIYLFPFDDDFRIKMGLSELCGQGALKISTCIDSDHWAEMEFGGAPLGDKRLSSRLVEIAQNKAVDPGRAYCGVTQGDWPQTKAYYRLIDKPNDSAVSMPNILKPHRGRTIQRMKAQKIVLCIQDGSDLNYNKLDQCEGLGAIGKNQTGAVSKGLHLHSMLTVNTEGLPLGILSAECTAPPLKTDQDKKKARKRPIEEKKSFQWIKGVRDSMELKAQMPHTTLVNVMDREADFFELFHDHQNNSQGVELLIRAKHDRKTSEGFRLFETVRSMPHRTRLKIQIPRQSSRPKKSKQKARPKRPARVAEVSVRYEQVELNPPLDLKSNESIPIWIIHVSEDHPSADSDPIEWFLLTTVHLKSDQMAMDCIKWYCLRWRIEDWHRVLKSGCGVEKLAHKTAQRLRRAIAINMVIAWRIMLMTLMGREMPQLPPEVLFTDIEIEILKAYAYKKNSCSGQPGRCSHSAGTNRRLP